MQFPTSTGRLPGRPRRGRITSIVPGRRRSCWTGRVRLPDTGGRRRCFRRTTPPSSTWPVRCRPMAISPTRLTRSSGRSCWRPVSPTSCSPSVRRRRRPGGRQRLRPATGNTWNCSRHRLMPRRSRTGSRGSRLDAGGEGSENPDMRPLLVFVLAGYVLTGIAAAQSLGEVARREEARRKAVTSGGKVYTGDSLRPDAAPAAPTAAPTPAPASPEKPAPAAQAATPDAADAAKKDEKSWRQRLSAERDALSRAELFAESLQSRINALTADFAARNDPFQRNHIGGDRQKALSELDR